jgi:hypothetical protein
MFHGSMDPSGFMWICIWGVNGAWVSSRFSRRRPASILGILDPWTPGILGALCAPQHVLQHEVYWVYCNKVMFSLQIHQILFTLNYFEQVWMIWGPQKTDAIWCHAMIAMIAMCEFRCLDMACPDEDVVNCVMFLLCIDFCIRTQLGQNGSSPFWSVLVRSGSKSSKHLQHSKASREKSSTWRCR